MAKKHTFAQEKDKFTRITLFWNPEEHPDIEQFYRNSRRGEFNQRVLEILTPKAKELSLVDIVENLARLTSETKKTQRAYGKVLSETKKGQQAYGKLLVEVLHKLDTIIAGNITVKHETVKRFENKEQRELLENLAKIGI